MCIYLYDVGRRCNDLKHRRGWEENTVPGWRKHNNKQASMCVCASVWSTMTWIIIFYEMTNTSIELIPIFVPVPVPFAAHSLASLSCVIACCCFFLSSNHLFNDTFMHSIKSFNSSQWRYTNNLSSPLYLFPFTFHNSRFYQNSSASSIRLVFVLSSLCVRFFYLPIFVYISCVF